jgi:SAM-dependent methyltransferase
MLPCPWCHEVNATTLFPRRDRLGEESFRYLRCDRCGLVRVDPQPSGEELRRHYPEEYEAFQERRENWLFRLGRQRLWGRRVNAVQRHLPPVPGRVLDVGCATGEFLQALQQRGWSVAGLEPKPPGPESGWEALRSRSPPWRKPLSRQGPST